MKPNAKQNLRKCEKKVLFARDEILKMIIGGCKKQKT